MRGECVAYGSRQGAPLGRRETQILVRRAVGRTVSSIATELHLSPHTVDQHLDNVAAKLGTRHPARLALWAVKLGFVNPDKALAADVDDG